MGGEDAAFGTRKDRPQPLMTTTEQDRKARSKNELFGQDNDSANAPSDSAGRRKTFTLKSKQLPPDFANQVLNLELQIDHGDFTMGTINDLMLLYSQAVEYYNGMNDEKYTYFESRIQNLLVRPEVLQVMANASKDPAKYAKQEEERLKKQASKSEKEIQQEKMKAYEQRKKERQLKLKGSSEINEEIKVAIDPIYKQAVQQVEQSA